VHTSSTCIIPLSICTHILQIPPVLRLLYSQYTVIIKKIVKDHVKCKAFMDLFQKFLCGRLAFYTISLVGIEILPEYLPPPPTQTTKPKHHQVPTKYLSPPSSDQAQTSNYILNLPFLCHPCVIQIPLPQPRAPPFPQPSQSFPRYTSKFFPFPPLCLRFQPITTPPRLFRIRRLPSLDFGSEARLTNTSQTLVLPSPGCGSSVGGFGER
jgi:hypothetical protein